MEYLPSYKDDVVLRHHGILGMKWGVRRYQNEDGSLTDAGKARQKRWKGPDTFRYRRLNRKADRGDRLRAQGKTITGEQSKAYAASMGLGMVGLATAASMAGQRVVFSNGGKYLGTLDSQTIVRGTSIATMALGLKTLKDQSDIRTSYRRDQARGDYWAG